MNRAIDELFTRAATWMGNQTGQPTAFVLAVLTIVVWAITGPIFNYSETWQLIINTGTTIVTFLMVFLIQNGQNRDIASIQAKLDELLYAIEGAREKFIGLEHLTSAQIEQVRLDLEKEVVKEETGKGKRLDTSLRHLMRRL